MSKVAIRVVDFLLAILGLIFTLPILVIVILVGYFDTKSPIFLQKRVGKNLKPFTLIKFRTMRADTKSVASHLVNTSNITQFGHILRKTKIDELPQLINVLKGDMSIVGPRPNLFSQQELIEIRREKGVYNVLPGITGLAQINNIDMSNPQLLASVDEQMIKSLSLKLYFSCIIMTATGKGQGDAAK